MKWILDTLNSAIHQNLCHSKIQEHYMIIKFLPAQTIATRVQKASSFNIVSSANLDKRDNNVKVLL